MALELDVGRLKAGEDPDGIERRRFDPQKLNAFAKPRAFL